MQKIKISNHPQFTNVERWFKFESIDTDLQTYAKIKGFVFYRIGTETPKGFNRNGEYYELLANSSTLVNSTTGEYSLEGDTTEIDYIKNISVSGLSVGQVLEMLVISSVLKQDRYNRFN